MKGQRRNAKEQELADNERLLRAWKKFYRDELTEALTSVHGTVMTRLMEQLKQLRSARELVDAIAAEDWSVVDAHTRLVALHEPNVAIAALRERSGLQPIDDPLPGQSENAFRIIKAMFDKFPAASGRAHRSVR